MRGAPLHRAPRVRSPKPLVMLAGLGRTFGSLISFLALLFLSWGIYLLADAFAHPIDAQAAALLVAAFAIAVAALLFFYLLKSWTSVSIARRARSEDSRVRKESFFRQPSAPAHPRDRARI